MYVPRHSLALILLLAACAGARGQAAPPGAGTIHRRVFVSVGIGAYEFWDAPNPQLNTPVNDVDDMSKELNKDFDFTIPPDMQLRDKQATKAEIIALIEEKLHAYLKPDDELVFMYSGHGARSDDKTMDAHGAPVELTRGFLVPWDARLFEKKTWSDYIDVAYLLDALASLPARHVLVILDSCNSGLAIREGIGSLGSKGAADEDKVGREVIAAAGPSESAAASSLFDKQHSLFTGLLLTELQQHDQSSEARDFLTGHELGELAAEKLSNDRSSHQTPLTGQFYGDKGGDVFFHFRESVPRLQDEALEALGSGNISSFRQCQQTLAAKFPKEPSTLWARYRLDLYNGDVKDAIAAVSALEQSDGAGRMIEEDTPLTHPGRKISVLLENNAFMNAPKKRGATGLSLAMLDEGRHAVDGEAELDSEGLFVLSKDRGSYIRLKNTATKPLEVHCVVIDPRGVLTNLGCESHDPAHPLDTSIHPGESLDIPIDAAGEERVDEVHFYVVPPASAAVPDPAQSAQTFLRIKFAAL